MATVNPGNYYRFKDYNNNKYLNLFATGNPANNTNVTIHTLDSSDMGQVWKCDSHSYSTVNGVLMKCAKDTTFALDRWRGSSNYNNADVYTIGTTVADLQDQLVEFILLTNGYYRIKLAYADLYLTVSTTVTSGGYNVNWQALTGNTNQLWAAELFGTSTATPDSTPSEIKDQEFFVKAYGTDLNLNVHGTNTVANARNVNVYEKENCDAQKWIAKQESAGPKLFTKINPSYALNINTADNNCTMYTASGNDDDSVLEFEEVADMLYRIKMFKHGKYLTIDGTAASGSNVVWSDTASTATLWEFIPEATMFPPVPSSPDAPSAIVGNTYAVQANGTDFYLNVYGTDTVADGRNVNIYSKEDCQAQRWFITNTDNGPKLFTRINESYALNIDTSDDNCTMYPAEDNDADSLLEFESVGDMLYRIKMFNHDKYLCIVGTAASGTNVKWIAGASTATVWKLIPEATAFPVPSAAPTDLVGKTFFIKNYNTGYNLNVHGTNTVALGRNVNVYAKENADAQKWKVVQTPKGPKIVTEINETFALNIHVENSNNCVMYDINDNNVDSVIEFVPYDENKNIYKLKMFHHDKYLEAAGVGSGFNAYWSDSPVYNLWQFVEEDDMFPVASAASSDIVDKTYYIQNVNTGHYLNVNGADTVANTRNVNVYAKEDCQAQRWIIRNKDGGPKLVTKINEAFAINIYANDNNCTMYAEEGNDIDSVLQFIPYTTGRTTAEDGVYRIKMHYHNRYLTVSNTNIGANAWWTSVDTEPYALWRLIPEGEMTFEDTVDPDTTPDSSLVTKFRAAPSGNYLVGRDGCTISEITIHHVGDVGATIDSVYDSWINSGETTSSHYCVYGTQVGQYVKERNTAYTNGGALLNPDDTDYNHRAVTIETCNSTGAPNWEVSDDTYYTLVRLVADIAKRNNLGTLVVGENLTWHSMYAATECPVPYLLARMQDIADRANEINAAYISGRIYLRKHNTDKFFSVDENSHIILVGKDEARPWVLEKTDDKTYICDFTNPMLKMNVDTDGTTLILTDGDSGVYASFLTEKTFDICYESVTSTFSQRSNSIKKWFSSLGKRLGLFNDEERDSVDSVTDVNEEVDSFTSVVPEFYQSRVVKIKHKETGKYMTYTGKNNILTKGYGNPVELKDMVSDNSDRSQIWKITKFGDDMFCLSSYAAANHSLELYTGNNICVSTNPGMYIPNSRVVSISEVSTGGFTISFPTFDNKYCSQYFEEENATNFICGSSINDSNAVWIFEEPEPNLLEGWLRAYYNPQDKYEDHQVTAIPNYAFYLPMSYFDNQEENNYTFDCIEKYKISNTEYATTPRTYCIKDSYKIDNNLYVTSFEAHTKNDKGNKKTVTLKFDDPNIWAAAGNYGEISNNVDVDTYGKTTDPVSNLYVDNNGYYWIAVGPKVVKKDILPSEQPGDDYYNVGTVDAVISDDAGRNYYIRCAIGDIKAHTWNNGVFQSGIAYQNPGTENSCHDLATNRFYESTISDEWAYDTFSNKACVEFIGYIDGVNYDFISKNEDFYKYHIERMIFYPYQ